MISKQALLTLFLFATLHNGMISAQRPGHVNAGRGAKDSGRLFKPKKTKKGKSSAKESKKFKSKSKSKGKGKGKGKDDSSDFMDYIEYEPLYTRNDYPEEYLNETYWHPESENFEIIDWDKWEDVCGDFFKGPGLVYEPPQRSLKNGLLDEDEMIWFQRNVLHFPEDWSTSVKPNVGLISDDSLDLLAKILGPHPDSSSVPEPLRNTLLWMEDNEASETLVSFNRGAWRSDIPGGRSVGLTLMETDWTSAQNAKGRGLADAVKNNFINWQVSPNGKYIKLARIFTQTGAPFKGKVYWLDMYIVQEGDEFTDGVGNILHDVKPGDIMRYTFNAFDPYTCDSGNYSFQYLVRKVATLDEDTGMIKPYSPHFERLQSYVAAHPPGELRLETHGFTNATSMSQEERWDFYVKHLSTYQQYASAATPPHGDLLEFD